ncbi:MAG: BMP family ABC transporter substrate-binding protein, partial [Thermoanaerobaculia bacterium]
MRLRTILSLAAVLAVAACSGPGGSDAGGGDRNPLFVYVSPDPMGVNPFLVMGQTGLERAAAAAGADTLVLESEDPISRDENVRAAIDEGAELVVVLGFEFGDILPRYARRHPGVDFLIVDQCIDEPPPNVRCAVFREYEGTFLIGAVAAALTRTGHVGIIAAVDIPFLHRYTDAFALGAREVDPQIEVSTLWVGGDNPFSDPVRAKEQALAMIADGADHIFAAAAAGNFGIFEAVSERSAYAFGLDVDQCPAAPGHIAESFLKRVDVAIVEAIAAIRSDSPERIFEYGLASGGIGLVSLSGEDLTGEDVANSQCLIFEHPEVIDAMRELRQRIIDGEIRIE